MPRRGDIPRLELAESLVGHKFIDSNLLEEALTHPSYVMGRGKRHYERLEFLGDAVLGLVVVEEIYRRFPKMTEGEMTKLKIAVVSGPILVEAARHLELERVLLFGESELVDGSRGLASALEDAFEALVAAIYLDAGLEEARTFVLEHLGNLIDPEQVAVVEHPKSRLQELLQARGQVPEYEVTGIEGPPHLRSFTAQVSVDGVVLGEGEGSSKRTAEMHAAEEALATLAAADESV